MASMMTSWFFLTALILTAMFIGADGNAGGLTTTQGVKAQCQKTPGALLPHPTLCHQYYNCSHPAPPSYAFYSPFLQECPYPRLFSPDSSSCLHYNKVTCGRRREPFDACMYLRLRCPRSHCTPCIYRYPSCAGKCDGPNVHRGRMWSPSYVVCRSQRPVRVTTCPRHPTLDITQFFHPTKNRCVSLYEIPTRYHGLQFNCTQKTDGLHLDDVTKRPYVYYHCHRGQLKDVERCESGQYFDQQRVTCTPRPLRNSIMGICGK